MHHLKADNYSLGALGFTPAEVNIVPELLVIIDQTWRHFLPEEKRTGRRVTKARRKRYIMTCRLPDGSPISPSMAEYLATASQRVSAMDGGRPPRNDEGEES